MTCKRSADMPDARPDPEVANTIFAYIRAGAYDYIAAEAAGISARTLREWVARGEARSSRPGSDSYSRFAAGYRLAKAEARATAEMKVFEEHPAYWLAHTARSAPERPGWSGADAPAHQGILTSAQAEEARRLASVFAGLALCRNSRLLVPRCSNRRCRCMWHRERTASELALTLRRVETDRKRIRMSRESDDAEPPRKPGSGRPRGSAMLTDDLQRRILTYIRSGCFDHVAAEACGVSARTMREWIARAEGRALRPADARFRRFARAYREAKAQARVIAEARLHDKDKKRWLAYMAKSRPLEPGWADADPGAPVPPKEHSKEWRSWAYAVWPTSTLLFHDAAHVLPACLQPRCRCMWHRCRTYEEHSQMRRRKEAGEWTEPKQ